MDRFSPKIEIINHFDNLINRVDIEVEECIEKYNSEQILGDLEWIRDERTFKTFKFPLCFHLSFFTTPEKNQGVEKSTKIIDYLNQVRERTIDELREAQKDSIEYFKSVSFDFKQHDGPIEGTKLDEIKSQIFGEKFYFQVRYNPKTEEEEKDEQGEWIFNLYTIVTDFYMSPTDINLLE